MPKLVPQPVVDANGCHLWQGHLCRKGYGRMKRNGKVLQAHRWFYEQSGRFIGDGMQLDHLCRVRQCVNPDHLEPVTGLENVNRGLKAKLSMVQIEEVRRLRTVGWSQQQIGDHFGVSQSAVSDTETGRRKIT